MTGLSKKQQDRRRDTWRFMRHGPPSHSCLCATNTRRDSVVENG